MITPLSQGALTNLGVFGMAGDSPFREAVDQVLSLKNFQDKTEWENAIQELFGSKESAFVPMYELFLSRSEYSSFDYGEVEDDDPHLREFIEKEDRCEYKNVYPFLESHEVAYDHFSYPRPLVLRRFLNEARARLSREGRNKKLIFVPETYDLVLPPAIRRTYYRRLRAALAPYMSSGNLQIVFPSQLPFVQEEIDRVLEREGKVSESNDKDRDEGQGTEGWPEEVASDELFKRTLQLNYRFATRFSLFVVRELARFSKEFFDRLADKYKNDPKGFIKAVHALLDAIHYASAMSPSFMPLFVIEKHAGENKDDYRAKAIATLLVFRHYSMTIDPYFAGMSVRPTMSLAFNGVPPVPRLSSTGAFSTVGNEFRKIVREVVETAISKEVGRRVSDVLAGFNIRTVFTARVPSSSVFDKGAISVFSGPSLFGGTIYITSPVLSLDFGSLLPDYTEALLSYAEKSLDSQDTTQVEELARRSFIAGFNFGRGRSS